MVNVLLHWCCTTQINLHANIGPSVFWKKIYACPKIYYVAGWTLQSVASRALTVSLQVMRKKYFSLVQWNNTTEEDAKQEWLPIGLAEKRTRRAAKMYASKACYNFICSVESIYLTN